MAKKLPPGKRYPLRLLQHRYVMLRWITVLIPVLSIVAWWVMSDEELWGYGKPLILTLAALTAILFLVALFAPFFCYMQCYADYILISSPFYRYKISYLHVTEVMPTSFPRLFPFKQQKELEQMLLTAIYKEFSGADLTAVAVGVKKFTQPLWLLKLFLGKYVFNTRKPGVVFVVRSRMQLSREIENYWHEWRDRRRKKQGSVSIASRILSKSAKAK